MNSSKLMPSIRSEHVAQPADIVIARLVGQVYESAPPSARGQLIEYLLRSVGVLSLLAVTNGVFAKIRFRSGWSDLHVRLEDIQNVRTADVVALVDHARHVSVEAVDGLARMLAVSPSMAGSAAAVMLVTFLVRRARAHRAGAGAMETGSPTSAPTLVARRAGVPYVPSDRAVFGAGPCPPVVSINSSTQRSAHR